MKRFLKLGPILLLIAPLLLASALAGPFLSGAITQSFAASAHQQDLRVFDHATAVKFITVGTPDDPRGNYVVFYDPVFDATDTHQIGHDSGICTVTSSTVQECHITFLFSQGEIAVQGPELLSGAASTVVVTGGTGIYTGVEGSATDRQVKTDTGTEFESVFHFAQ